jgi:hypothetical protein
VDEGFHRGADGENDERRLGAQPGEVGREGDLVIAGEEIDRERRR